MHAVVQPVEPVYRFDNNELRPATRQLLVGGQPATLGARAFDVLLALVAHRDRMLAKNELLDIVWPNLVVEENNLQVHVSALRKVLGAKAIATVPGRGYRFAAALEEETASAAHMAELVVARPAPTTPAAPLHADAGNLPATLAPMLGRDADLAALRELVPRERLVSLLGAGGIGKTTLARTLARSLAPSFADGAWMVELVNIADPAALPNAVARTLGINLPGRADAVIELCERMRGGELLVLDNCEHLVDAVAALVAHLLDALPQLHVLATSQEPLRLAAERPVRLDALAVPRDAVLADAAGHGAVALFVARVAALQPGFALGQDNLDAVIDICRELDGMPLALELAAARVPMLGVQGVRQHLAQRLKLLNNGARDAPSRHRTLRATLDWSHALLGPDEQKVFRRLGVCVGGFGLELAQQIAADEAIDAWAVLDHLGTLIEKSMIVVEPGPVPRYRLLETARAYAREQLEAAGEWELLRQWHARCMWKAIDRRQRNARLGPETTDQWFAVCGPEVHNLRSAIEWACAPGGDAELGIALVNAAAVLMYQAGRFPEGTRWMKLAEPLIDASTPPLLLAEFRWGTALVGLHGGVDASQRLQLLDQSRAVFEQQGQHVLTVLNLCMSAYVAAVHGDFERAERYIAQSQPLVDLPALRPLRGTWFYSTGMVRRYQDRLDEALAAFSRALPAARAEGNARTLFYVLNNLAAMHQELGHVDEAVNQFRAMLEHLQRSPLTDAQMMAFSLNWYAHALTAQGALDEAQARVIESLPYCRRSVGVRHFAGMLSLLAARRGRLRDAALLIGCDDAARVRRGEQRTAADARTLAASMALIAAVHPVTLIEAWRLEGSEMDEEQAAGVAAH